MLNPDAKFSSARAAQQALAKNLPAGLKKPTKFMLTLFDVLTVGTERTYLVKGLIPRVGLTVLWGPPKCGKSFWAFDVAMHVALGWEYRDRRTSQGSVVYCAFEGAEGFKARAEAFRQRHLADQHDSVPFYLMPTRANLVTEHAELIRAIQAEHIVPAAVVLDTLNRSLDGSENEPKDMSAYVRAADAIRETFSCAVIIVHHCGAEGTRPRGHTSLTGAADAQLACKRDHAGNVEVTVEWMKDGPEGATITSQLESVVVGRDEDGDLITSCVIVPADRAAQSKKPAATKLPKAAQTALRALTEALNEQGAVPPASNHIPDNTKTVTTTAWRQQAYLRGISTSSEERARQQAFKRASEHLIGSSRVGVWDDQVWITA